MNQHRFLVSACLLCAMFFALPAFGATALAQVSGEAVIHSLIYLIIVGVIFGLLWWLISYCALPQPFDKVARVILAIAAVIILITILLSMAGHPLVKW